MKIELSEVKESNQRLFDFKNLVKEMRTAQKEARKATKDNPERKELFQKSNFLEKQVDEICGIGTSTPLF